MENEFTAFASANVMVSNITYEKAAELAENRVKLKIIATVSFDDRRNTMRPHLRFSRLPFSAESEDERRSMRLNRLRTAFRIMK